MQYPTPGSNPTRDDQLEAALHKRSNLIGNVVYWVATGATIAAFFAVIATSIGIREPKGQVIFALGSLGILGFMIFAWAQFRMLQGVRSEAQRAKKEIEFRFGASAGAMYRMACLLVGVARDDYVRQAFVKNDGSVSSTVCMTVRAVSQRVQGIEHKYKPDPTINNAPHKEVLRLTPLITKYGKYTAKMSSEIEPNGREACHEIRFTPPLEAGASFRFTDSNPLRQNSPPGTMAMSLAELRRRRLGGSLPFYEYSAVTATHPCNNLISRVTFEPEEFDPSNCRAVAWSGGYHVNETETDRMSRQGNLDIGQDDQNRFYIELRVPFPVLGQRYVICWEPPDIQEGGAGITPSKTNLEQEKDSRSNS